MFGLHFHPCTATLFLRNDLNTAVSNEAVRCIHRQQSLRLCHTFQSLPVLFFLQPHGPRAELAGLQKMPHDLRYQFHILQCHHFRNRRLSSDLHRRQNLHGIIICIIDRITGIPIARVIEYRRPASAEFSAQIMSFSPWFLRQKKTVNPAVFDCSSQLVCHLFPGLFTQICPAVFLLLRKVLPCRGTLSGKIHPDTPDLCISFISKMHGTAIHDLPIFEIFVFVKRFRHLNIRRFCLDPNCIQHLRVDHLAAGRQIYLFQFRQFCQQTAV